MLTFLTPPPPTPPTSPLPLQSAQSVHVVWHFWRRKKKYSGSDIILIRNSKLLMVDMLIPVH